MSCFALASAENLQHVLSKLSPEKRGILEIDAQWRSIAKLETEFEIAA
jgi:hypothetical protein